jgi:hypothetical protein
MTENIQAPPEGHAEIPTTRYERRDVNARGIVLVGVAMIVCAVVIHLVAWWVFDYLQARDKARKQSPFPLAATEPKKPTPEPRLEQVNRMAGKVEDARPLYAAERKRLETYGRVPDEKGVIRIPIQRAMELIVEEKRLPAREEPPKSDEDGRRQ